MEQKKIRIMGNIRTWLKKKRGKGEKRIYASNINANGKKLITLVHTIVWKEERVNGPSPHLENL
jgi:hypothetical protein